NHRHPRPPPRSLQLPPSHPRSSLALESAFFGSSLYPRGKGSNHTFLQLEQVRPRATHSLSSHTVSPEPTTSSFSPALAFLFHPSCRRLTCTSIRVPESTVEESPPIGIL